VTLNREELLKKQKEYEEQSQKYFEETMREKQAIMSSNEMINFFRRIPVQTAKKKPDYWDIANDLSEPTLRVIIQWIKKHDLNRKVQFWTPYVLPILEKKLKTYRKGTSQKSMAYEKIKNQFTVEELAEKHTKLGRVSNGKRSGVCPLHMDTDPSFTVYLDTNSFYCFGCHKGGDVITLFYALKEMNK
tara:strand:- start:29 stop:592 length:564 start_codon:yes stop_codon:yes gene_type:complete